MVDGSRVTIRTILCAIDFSDSAAHVAEQAAAIAGWCGARVVALHVYAPTLMPVPGLPVPVERVPDAERERALAQLTATMQPATAHGIACEVRVDVGPAAAGILDGGVAIGADLIVMGTHGASGFERLMLGSVAEKVLRRAPCPVLTVPPRAHTTAVLPFRRVVCGVDFSQPSLRALRYAQALAQGAGAHLTVVHVLEWPWTEPPAPVFDELPREQASALREYRRALEESAATRLTALLPDRPFGAHAVRRVVHGRSYVEILRTAGEEHADLVVVGVHGRSAVDLALLGSTANQLVRGAACPVLTIRS